MPSALGTHQLNDVADLLGSYPDLDLSTAVALIRSARAYQAGLWVAEDDPEYAWLKFVSAVETAADHWWQGQADPAEHLEAWDQGLFERLQQAGGAELVDYAAEKLVQVTRSTRKFLDFLDAFKPPPPESRPEPAMQVDWSKLRHGLSQIYGYRSKSLHGGKAFPGPLLDGPIRYPNTEERPLGLAAAVGQSVWKAEDLPMYLHIFEHIARRALLTWWAASSESR
ncbi:MAG: hypothetical protein P1T08_06580 [Acidimicrobiia bacterium]|nr:hypothetical protein [Acidimicrobiia bacterium]